MSAPRLTSMSTINPNVFSDDYALDDFEDSASPSSVSSLRPADPYSAVDMFSTPRASVDIDRSASSASSVPNRPSSTLKRPRETPNPLPHRAISAVSNTESGTYRTSSTSSRFSMPRSQSPYVGATGPSHPYAMYPQVTRASSVASGSTIQAADTGFVVPTGPEHPYAMYPQNTVPEEEDSAPNLPLSIGLGFPGMGQAYQQGTRSAGDDIADIVGADGHIEQLPPYTRYPDAGVAKEPPPLVDIPTIGQTRGRSDSPMSSQSTRSQFFDNDVALNVAASRTAGSESDGSLKERWKEKSKRRVLCGLPLWVLLVIIAIMILVGAIGGVIGGVVGTEHSADSQASAQADRATPTAPATVTVTSWIDAGPLPSGQSVPSVPTGEYNVPTNEISLSSNSCIVDTQLSSAWGCMPPGGVGIEITPYGPSYQIAFDQYPVAINFTYGPQRPYFNTAYPLLPSMDKEANDLGPSLFFYTLYDKLSILPSNAFESNDPQKRSLSVNEVESRDFAPLGQIAQTGDKPWFCWFNATVFEFFMYPEFNTTSSSSDTTVTGSSWPSAQTSTKSFVNAGIAPPFSTTTYPPPPAGTFPSPPPAWQSSSAAENERRGWGEDEENQRDPYPNYPRYIKMQEKRKPDNNVPPYCQQMQILWDWQIVPTSANIIQVSENEPSSNSNNKRATNNEGSTAALNTDCVCEWLATT